MKKIPTVYLEEKLHRGASRILIRFHYHQKLIDITKSIKGAKWSATLTSWYLEKSDENLNIIYSCFSGLTTINDINLFRKTKQKYNLNTN